MSTLAELQAHVKTFLYGNANFVPKIDYYAYIPRTGIYFFCVNPVRVHDTRNTYDITCIGSICINSTNSVPTYYNSDENHLIPNIHGYIKYDNKKYIIGKNIGSIRTGIHSFNLDRDIITDMLFIKDKFMGSGYTNDVENLRNTQAYVDYVDRHYSSDNPDDRIHERTFPIIAYYPMEVNLEMRSYEMFSDNKHIIKNKKTPA